MEVNIIKSEKNELEVEVNNVTIAEILRVYLQNQGIEFAAWRRSHPSKPALFKIESKDKTVKKAISEAVAAVKKDLDKVASAAKK